MIEIIKRETIYFLYYFEIQLHQIFVYWSLGILAGSAISVFVKDKISITTQNLKYTNSLLNIIIASILGIASPLCMYGTIPLCASLSKKGLSDYTLAAFMTSSILLNPQLIIYSLALGKTLLILRIVFCFLMGVTSGVLILIFYKEKKFFDFDKFNIAEKKSKDTDKNLFIRYIKNVYRNIKATGLYVLLGIILSCIFERWIPKTILENSILSQNAFAVLLTATIGVPLYACGGGTIPLLLNWLDNGMSNASALAFMLTGPATKITNLTALKSALGKKHFLIYFVYVILFAVVSGLAVLVVKS